MRCLGVVATRPQPESPVARLRQAGLVISAITQADKLTKAVVVADIPEKKRPTVYVKRTDGPEFAATLATLKASDPYEACQLPPVDVIVERPTP